MERTVATKLARDLEGRKILPADRGGGWGGREGGTPGKCTCKDSAAYTVSASRLTMEVEAVTVNI